MKTNPNAMLTIQKNTIFTNVAETSDGGYYWEGLEEGEYNPDASVTTWKNEENWQMNSGTVAAHPNSRSVATVAAHPNSRSVAAVAAHPNSRSVMSLDSSGTCPMALHTNFFQDGFNINLTYCICTSTCTHVSYCVWALMPTGSARPPRSAP